MLKSMKYWLLKLLDTYTQMLKVIRYHHKCNLEIPPIQTLLPHGLIPILHIRQSNMRTIRILFPLRPRSRKTCLLFSPGNQFFHLASSVITQLLGISSALSIFLHLSSQLSGGSFIDCEVAGTNDNAIVLRGTGHSDEFLVYFGGDNVCRAGEWVAETAATPSYPFEDVTYLT